MIQCLNSKIKNNYLESVYACDVNICFIYHYGVTILFWWRKEMYNTMLADRLLGILQMLLLGISLRGVVAAHDHDHTPPSVGRRKDTRTHQ